MINNVFYKMLIWSSSSQKNTGGQKLKGTHFIGVRVRCLQINQNSDKKKLFSKNEHFHLFNKTYASNPTKITFTCLWITFTFNVYFFMLFPKTLPYFIGSIWHGKWSTIFGGFWMKGIPGSNIYFYYSKTIS